MNIMGNWVRFWTVCIGLGVGCTGLGAAGLDGLDESVNWTVENPVDQNFAETPQRTATRSRPQADGFRSIHQIQQEQYDALELTTEAEFDALAGREPLAPPRAAKAAGALRKRVVGWHPYWMGSSYQNYDYSTLDTLAYFSYEVNPTNGSYTTLRSWDTTPAIAWAQSRGTKVVLTATLMGSANNETLLSNPASRAALINSLVNVVSNYGGDGVNIDFENVGGTMRENLTTFMSNLTVRFHQDIPGSEVSIALPAVDWGKAFDVAAYDEFLDYALIMGYDYHWSSSTDAGPVAPLSSSAKWGAYCVEKSIDDYLAAGISAEKLLLASPYYGYDWPTASATPGADTLGVGDSQTYAETYTNAPVRGRLWDAAGSVPYFVYTNAAVVHQCWYDDEESLGLKYDLVNAKGIGGIGIWALGYDGSRTELWELIGEKFTLEGQVWTEQVSGTAESLYGAGANGETWTAESSGTTEFLRGLAWGNGRFVTTGYNGTVLTKGTAPSAPPTGAPLEETAASQPAGGLSDIIVYTSGGHGAIGDTGSWVFGRPLVNGVVEDIGNIDQLNYFADYCFKAGATVVPMRPLGNQTNEVVLDNTHSASVTFGGSWSDSTSTTYYGAVSATPFRYAYINTTGTTAWAIYRPTIPNAGFYPVYAWARSGSDRVKQLYRVYHSGGVTDVRVNHRRVGLGWVWLGTYYFDAGTNGSVNISNHAPGGYLSTDVVIADAIRFGNGMGDINRGSGVSGLPRELEGSRYWVQAMTGQGMSSDLYNGSTSGDITDNVGAPSRMAAEMNRETDGGFWDRIYLGFHSNAGGGTARGPVGLYDTRPAVTIQNRQKDFGVLMAREFTNALFYGDSGVWFPDTYGNNRANLYVGGLHGEINNSDMHNEMNSTIIETAFHDNVDDANLLKCPAARRVMAMASYQAIVKHLTTNNPAVVSPVLLPDPPTHVAVANDGVGAVTLRWRAPVVNGASGDAATGYVIYRSTNGYGFGNPVTVSGGTTTTTTLTNMPATQIFYFQVCATNAGGESLASETIGVRVSPAGFAPHLVVNGFDRNERRISPTQVVTNNINGNVTRVIQRKINSRDYVIQHGEAIAAAGRYFDSCANEAVEDGDVALTDYHAAYWILGRESTADETFSSTEQSAVSAFLSGGGNLFVSGTELVWDLDRQGTTSDKLFAANALKMAYGADDAGTGTVTARTGGVFDGLGTFAFDYAGTGGLYKASYPDRLLARGSPSSVTALVYGTSSSATTVAGLAYSNTYDLVVLGFPFETIFSESTRETLLSNTIDFFGDAPADAPVVAITTPNQTLPSGTEYIWVDGTNNAAVTGPLSWTNALTGGRGSVTTGTTWSIAVSLTTGVNTITVRGTNYLLTQTARDTVLVEVEAASSGNGTTLIDEPFDEAPLEPAGWSFNSVVAYSSSLNAGRATPSVKFDSTGDNITSPTFSGGTTLTFWVRANPSSGTHSVGTFVVERNIGGTWSTLLTVTDPVNVGTTHSVALSTSVIQLRFTWNKTSGNIALDDVIVTGVGGGGATDTDGDGMPDAYEMLYFGGPTNGVASADDDGDGISNYAEYIAGTHPGNGTSVLALESLVVNTNTATLVFQWPSVTGRVYSLWRTTNALAAYTQHVGSIAANAPINTYTNAAPAAMGSYFYGLKVSWPDAP